MERMRQKHYRNPKLDCEKLSTASVKKRTKFMGFTLHWIQSMCFLLSIWHISIRTTVIPRFSPENIQKKNYRNLLKNRIELSKIDTQTYNWLLMIDQKYKVLCSSCVDFPMKVEQLKSFGLHKWRCHTSKQPAVKLSWACTSSTVAYFKAILHFHQYFCSIPVSLMFVYTIFNTFWLHIPK